MSDAPSPARHEPDGLVIRASRPDDAEGLTELANLPGFRYGTMRLPFQRVAETRRWLEGLKDSDVGLVAILDQRLVGSAGLSRFGGRRSHAAVLALGVHDDHAGTGIGSALLAALIDTADRWWGLKRTELTVFADNAAAIALYRRFGFEQEGLLRSFAFRDGAYADALAMARLR